MTTLAEIKSKVEIRSYACQAAEQHLKFLLGKLEELREATKWAFPNGPTDDIRSIIKGDYTIPDYWPEVNKHHMQVLLETLTAGKE